MKQIRLKTKQVKQILFLLLPAFLITTFTGFKEPLRKSNCRNSYPVIYLVYAYGSQGDPSSYYTPQTETECLGDGLLCAIYVEDRNFNNSISALELANFFYDYDSNGNGMLDDEAYIPGVLIKKSYIQ